MINSSGKYRRGAANLDRLDAREDVSSDSYVVIAMATLVSGNICAVARGTNMGLKGILVGVGTRPVHAFAWEILALGNPRLAAPLAYN